MLCRTASRTLSAIGRSPRTSSAGTPSSPSRAESIPTTKPSSRAGEASCSHSDAFSSAAASAARRCSARSDSSSVAAHCATVRGPTSTSAWRIELISWEVGPAAEFRKRSTRMLRAGSLRSARSTSSKSALAQRVTALRTAAARGPESVRPGTASGRAKWKPCSSCAPSETTATASVCGLDLLGQDHEVAPGQHAHVLGEAVDAEGPHVELHVRDEVEQRRGARGPREVVQRDLVALQAQRREAVEQQRVDELVLEQLEHDARRGKGSGSTLSRNSRLTLIQTGLPAVTSSRRASRNVETRTDAVARSPPPVRASPSPRNSSSCACTRPDTSRMGWRATSVRDPSATVTPS